MESQKTVKGPEKPAAVKKEGQPSEQLTNQFDSFSAALAAAKQNTANPPAGGGNPNSSPFGKTGGLPPRNIMHLQRTIGNQATNRLLRKTDSSATQSTANVLSQSDIHPAPTDSIQRDLFGFKKRKQKRDQKKQQKQTDWQNLLGNYDQQKADALVQLVLDAVKAHVAKMSTEKLLGLEGDIRTKAQTDIKDQFSQQVQTLQDEINDPSTDDDRKREAGFELKREQAHVSDTDGQVNDAIGAHLRTNVTGGLNAKVMNVQEVNDAVQKDADIKKALSDYIAAKDRTQPMSDKDFDKELKKLMQGSVTEIANREAWGIASKYIDDHKDELVTYFATGLNQPVQTVRTTLDTQKDQWNQKLIDLEKAALDPSPAQDWPKYITTTVAGKLPKFLKDKLQSQDRETRLITAVKLAITAKVQEIEQNLQTQIDGTVDPVAKRRLELEKGKVQDRFGKKAEEIVDKDKPEYQRIINETITKLLATKDVKDLIDAKSFVTSKVRGLLDPKRDTKISSSVEKQLNKDLTLLKKQALSEWETKAETMVQDYVNNQANEQTITNLFVQEMGVTDQGATQDRATTAGTNLVKGMHDKDELSKVKVEADKDFYKSLYTTDVLGKVTEYLANKFGKKGMGWTSFRSEKAKAFRKNLKDKARQKAYDEIDVEKHTHVKSSTMTDTGKDYIGHLAKSKAYKYSKEIVNDYMGELAEAEAKILVPEADVLFELDMVARDAITAARNQLIKGSLTMVGRNAAKAHAPKLFEKYKLIAKERKNQLIGKGGNLPVGVQQSTTTEQDVETEVVGNVTKAKVANRAITKAIEADSVTQGYNKLAHLINLMVPTQGDEVKIDVQFRIPVGYIYPPVYVMFSIAGKAARDSVEEVKASISVSGGIVLTFWGGEGTAKIGYFIEAGADSAAKLGMLMSYGMFRQMSSPGPVGLLPVIADYLWGGVGTKYEKGSKNNNRKFSEWWASMVEETAMQRHYLPDPDNNAPPLTVGDDAFRKKDGRIIATSLISKAGKQEGREYLGKVTHIADAKPSITAGGYSFEYDDAGAGKAGGAIKAPGSGPISKGTKVYAKDWSANILQLTTEKTSPGVGGGNPTDNHPIGKVEEITKASKKIYVDNKSGVGLNYVDIGLLVEASGNLNFGVGKIEGLGSYKHLNRFNKKVIDDLAKDQYGKSYFGKPGSTNTDIEDKRKKLGSGEIRNMLELESKLEMQFGNLKTTMGIGGKFVWSNMSNQGTGGLAEFEVQGSFGIPSEYLDSELTPENKWISRVGGSFASALKTIVGRAWEQRKANKEIGDKTGRVGKEVGVVTDTLTDLSFPITQFVGEGTEKIVYDGLIKALGTSGKMDSANYDIGNFLTGNDDWGGGKSVNKLAMKNETAVTLKYGWEHGRSKFSIDFKQAKGVEVDLVNFKAKIEKSKELIKIGWAQGDTIHKVHPTDNPPNDTTAQFTKVYFKDGKLTLDRTPDFAGKFIRYDDALKIATVRKWSGPLGSGNFLGITW